jgi:cysteine-rich repeat protein
LEDCNDNDNCTVDTLGQAGTCQALCDNAPITTCDSTTSDSCCPAGCDTQTDIDCGGCGNGVIEASYGEECDDGNSDNTDGCSNSCTNNNGSAGDTCLVNNDCIGQLDCLDEVTYGLVDGYCVSNDVCDPAFPSLGCGPKGTCVSTLGLYVGAVCAQRCVDIPDCRWADGYTCQLVGAGVSACLP